MGRKILVVDDETAIREMIGFVLSGAGFDYVEAENTERAEELVLAEPPDLILLDWMMPGASGIEFAHRLRRDEHTRGIPIIMLTARGEEDDKVRGLESGADDYVVKPYSPGEMIARMRAVLRRVRPEFADQVLEYADLRMDLAQHKVTRGGTPVHLGPTEFRLLRTMMERPGRVFSREQLLDRAWGRDIYVEIRTVDVNVRRLRRALNAAGGPDLIRTVRSAGYAIDTATH